MMAKLACGLHVADISDLVVCISRVRAKINGLLGLGGEGQTLS